MPLLALALAVAWPAQAGWWIFGKESGRPEMKSVSIGGVDPGRSDGKMSFQRNHLKEGRLEIKGFFWAPPKSIVAEVKLSLDGGKTWVDQEKISLDKDSFIYSFAPKPEQDYDLRAAVVDTKDNASDAGDLPRAVFVYHEKSGEDMAQAGLLGLASQYAARNQSGFNALISSDYQGDSGSLQDAVARDFREFKEIKLSVIPSRTLISGPDAKIDFHYDVSRLRAADSTVSKDSGLATYTLRLEGDRYKLLQMPRPIIFGVSEQGNDAGGEGVAPGVVTGSGQLTAAMPLTPFDFASGSVHPQGDVNVNCGDFEAGPPRGIQLIGSVPLDSVTEAPAGGYVSGTNGVSSGGTYAVRTQSGKYAVLQVTGIQGSGCPSFTVNFNYLYQTNGTRVFRQ